MVLIICIKNALNLTNGSGQTDRWVNGQTNKMDRRMDGRMHTWMTPKLNPSNFVRGDNI